MLRSADLVRKKSIENRFFLFFVPANPSPMAPNSSRGSACQADRADLSLPTASVRVLVGCSGVRLGVDLSQGLMAPACVRLTFVGTLLRLNSALRCLFRRRSGQLSALWLVLCLADAIER